MLASRNKGACSVGGDTLFLKSALVSMLDHRFGQPSTTRRARPKLFPLCSCSLREPASQMLNLRANCIKDAGVEAMSCATLGQEYNDHRKRQSKVRRQRRGLNATSGTSVNAWEAQQSGRPIVESSASAVQTLQEANSGGDLPPLAGTPLYAAAIGTWPNTRHQSPHMKAPPRLTAWSVVLDGNMASERVVAGQGALAGLGEVALFRGCVLPETVAVNQSWARDAFWTKTGAGRVLSRGG